MNSNKPHTKTPPKTPKKKSYDWLKQTTEEEKLPSKAGNKSIHLSAAKFNNEQRLEIVAMSAFGNTPSEVNQYLGEKYSLHVSPAQIGRYIQTKKWGDIFRKMRDEYVADVKGVAGFHKRVRLERMERTYDRAVAKGDLKHQVLSTEQQRKEADGDIPQQQTFFFNQVNFNTLSSDELVYRKKDLYERLRLVEKQKEEPNGQERNEDKTGNERLEA